MSELRSAQFIGQSLQDGSVRKRSAANPRHYFSRRTIRRANAYRDIGWGRLGIQFLVAALLISAILAPDGGDLAVLVWLGGLLLALCTAYTFALKLLDAARRH